MPTLPLLALVACALAATPRAQAPGSVLRADKLSATSGSLVGPLADGDRFGTSIAFLGDVDGDCYGDFAIGSPQANGTANDEGVVTVVLMNSDGTARAEQRIGTAAGGFPATLDGNDFFGVSLASLGDLDGDGVPDLAVGASRDDDGAKDSGAVWILFLASDGSVKSHAKISATSGGLVGALAGGDHFGSSVAALGDLNGDGTTDLAVGAELDDTGGTNHGAVWVLLLDPSGSVIGETKLAEGLGGFAGALATDDHFGVSIAALDDLDGDGLSELAVGADGDDDGGNGRGALWLLFLSSDGTAHRTEKIDSASGLPLGDFDAFGASVAAAGDVDGNGVPDLAVGATGDDDGPNLNQGAVWILFLDATGAMTSFQKVSATSGGFGGTLERNDGFGAALAGIADFDGDGFVDLAVGASGDDDGGSDRGALWLLYLQGNTPVGFHIRNGSGLNPVRLTTSGTPALGAPWQAMIDCTGHQPGVLLHVGVTAPSSGVFVPGGEILIQFGAPRLFSRGVMHSGGVEVLTYDVQLDLNLCGIFGYSQALIGGAPYTELTNALDFQARR